jgi:hypothetical protein
MDKDHVCPVTRLHSMDCYNCKHYDAGEALCLYGAGSTRPTTVQSYVQTEQETRQVGRKITPDGGETDGGSHGNPGAIFGQFPKTATIDGGGWGKRG